MYGETTTSGGIPSSCTCIILYILPTVYKLKKEKKKKTIALLWNEKKDNNVMLESWPWSSIGQLFK